MKSRWLMSLTLLFLVFVAAPAQAQEKPPSLGEVLKRAAEAGALKLAAKTTVYKQSGVQRPK